ncbi:MAG: tRNA dihydrouridine synthase DusB [Gloeocapsa sp. DLM2.Bin57]|nr:MAG: tRNA dihydrouridine synthase DusB [Gloeocapsa sp. DLM2.Bin57]
MAEAAQKAVAEGALTIDINMGCPVNKITKKGGGSSLLRQPEVARAIIETVVNAVDVPVTAKTRIGWDDTEINIVEFAQMLEDSGASMLTIHGRTRAQGYHGEARYSWIKKVKEVVEIPVIANGDIFSLEAALKCLTITGADGVMCSRGTLGYPFLVGEIEHFFRTGEVLPPPSISELLTCAQEHLQGLWEYKGYRGICQSRKHLAWYCKGFPGAAQLREQLAQINTLTEGLDLLQKAKESAII